MREIFQRQRYNVHKGRITLKPGGEINVRSLLNAFKIADNPLTPRQYIVKSCMSSRLAARSLLVKIILLGNRDFVMTVR